VIAETVGADFGVHWFPTAREILVFRQLHEDRCDLVMGLPVTSRFTDDKPRLAFSIPYYVMRQALVSPSVGGVRSAGELGPKLVGVQAMTLSDALVYERGFTRKVYRTAEETFAALATAEVDAIVMESPLAGWFVKKTPGFQAVAISDPDRELPIGAAVRKTDVELKNAVDRAIRQLTPRALPDILLRHGIAVAQAPPTPAAPAPAPPQPPSQTQSPTPEQRAARSTYLTQCSQCHGIDAAGTAAAANLRSFKGTEDEFLKIVQNGRPGTGMTPWKGIISDDDIRAIYRYVKSLAQGS